MFEYTQSRPEIELFTDDCRGVDLHSVKGQFLLLRRQEFRALGIIWEVPESKDGEEHGTSGHVSVLQLD